MPLHVNLTMIDVVNHGAVHSWWSCYEKLTDHVVVVLSDCSILVLRIVIVGFWMSECLKPGMSRGCCTPIFFLFFLNADTEHTNPAVSYAHVGCA